VAAHFHDYGQLRYAARGVLVTATQVGTWVAPADGGCPRGESYAARALDAGPTTESDVAWPQYTGGRTGRPQGVMLLQRPAEG
jgi:acyl-CoA synthetase (AMP-forming)/AMP-acid ligase II